jgi:putative tricarboxylic transport membrane protein
MDAPDHSLLQNARRSVRANDALSGLVIILLSLAMIALTLSFPAFPGQKFGPALFPRILGTGLIICGVLMIWNGITSRRPGSGWIEIAPWVRDPWRLTSFILVLAMLLLYILLSETVGFIPIAFLFLLTLFVWLGVRVISSVIIAVIATLAIHWFFSTMLRVPLPRGWLNTIL